MSTSGAPAAAALPPLVAATVGRLVRYVDPDCVVNFGSSQRGSATARSDIDLLLIGPSEVNVGERRSRVDRLFTHWPVPIDALWLTPQEAAARLHAGNPFLCSVIELGTVMFGDVAVYRDMLTRPVAG